MVPVVQVAEVLNAFRRVKREASAFLTNLYVGEPKLETWIRNGELFKIENGRGAFFLRKDRDFWRLYFCVGTTTDLRRGVEGLSWVHSRPVVLDLVGKSAELEELVGSVRPSGFRPYSRLLRMARLGLPEGPLPGSHGPAVGYADLEDIPAIEELLHRCFDRFADQLPAPEEIRESIEKRQILAVKDVQKMAALLLFETQGFTSAVRYWVVAESFRACGLGTSLMRHYFALHHQVRRFVLWVRADNREAVRRYDHFGYSPDGLTDLVLANEWIPYEIAA